MLHLVCHVAIDIQRERGGSMAQIALHRFGIIPSPERRRRNGNNGCLSRGPAHGKAFAGRIGHSIAGCFRTGCCLVKPAGLGPSPPGLKRDFGAACLTKRRTGDMMHRTEKALKRTLSGHDSREEPPLAASRSRPGAQPPPWSRPPICRLGRDLPLQRTRAASRWDASRVEPWSVCASPLEPRGEAFLFCPQIKEVKIMSDENKNGTPAPT